MTDIVITAANRPTSVRTGTLFQHDSSNSFQFRVYSASDDFVASDVGNVIIMMTSGDARHMYREVASRVGADPASRVTLDAQFGTSPFRGLTSLRTNTNMTEPTPATDDTYSLSITMAELRASTIDGVAMSTIIDFDSESDTYTIGSAHTIEFAADAGICIYDQRIGLKFNYGAGQLLINPGNGVILGKQNFGDLSDADGLGYPSESCSVIDTSTAAISGDTENRGAFIMNGGHFRGAAGTFGTRSFWRFNDSTDLTNDAAQVFRLWGVNMDGTFGGRISGDQSVIYNVILTGSINSASAGDLGVNPIRPGIFQNMSFRDCRTAIYSFPSAAGTVTVEATSIQDILPTTGQLLFVNMSGGPDAETLTLKNWDIGQIEDVLSADSSPVLLDAVGSSVNLQTFEIVKDYTLTFTNPDGSDFTGGQGKLVLTNAQAASSISTSDSTDNGLFDPQTLEAYTFTSSGADVPDLDAAIVTKVKGWTWSTKFRNQIVFSGSTELLGPLGPINESYALVADPDITETDTSVVDAYTQLETSAKLYDFVDGYKYDNPTLPTQSDKFFTKSASTLSTVVAAGNVVFDADATEAFDFTQVAAPSLQVDNRDNFSVTVANNWGVFGGADSSSVSNVTTSTNWSDYESKFIVFIPDTGDTTTDLFDSLDGGADIIIGPADNEATFSVTSTGLSSDGTSFIEIGTRQDSGSNTLAISTIAQDDIFLNIRADEADTITYVVAVPSTGYSDGISTSTGDITFNTTIQGEASAATLLISGTIPETIIDTTEAVSGVINLPAGSYIINDADVSGLTVNRADGETENVNLNLVDTSGTITLGANVIQEDTLIITVTGGPTDGVNIYVFESSTSAFGTSTGASTVTFSSDDHDEITDAASLSVVITAPGYSDIYDEITLIAGANQETYNMTNQGLPSVDPDDYDATFTATYNTSSFDLTVEVDNAGATDAEMTTTRTNYFVNQLKDDPEYITAVNATGTINIIGSEGPSGYAEAVKGLIEFTPASNNAQSLAFIRRLGTSNSLITKDRSVSATIDGTLTTVNFSMTIPSSAPVFDLGGIQQVVDDQTDSIKGSGDKDLTQVNSKTKLIPVLLKNS